MTTVTAPAKILVVDDTPANVKLLQDLRTVKGYVVGDRRARRTLSPWSRPIDRTGPARRRHARDERL